MQLLNLIKVGLSTWGTTCNGEKIFMHAIIYVSIYLQN
jgi:hypothetical protein